jgi:hypothetical protein
MNGIELALRFSYITNSLRFCGPEIAHKQFLEYLDKKDNIGEVENSLLKFESLKPYLTSIAEKAKKDCFDYKVAEAYWIGNELLDDFNDKDMEEIITKLILRGLPKLIAEKLIENLPSGLVPHHNFNVMYVGVGMTTQAVETNLQNMDNCRISWGKVIEVLQDKLIVTTNSLIKNNDKFELKEGETKTIVYLPQMLNDIKKDDIVALHWGFAAMVLNNVQLGNLEKYTNKILNVLNKVG